MHVHLPLDARTLTFGCMYTYLWMHVHLPLDARHLPLDACTLPLDARHLPLDARTLTFGCTYTYVIAIFYIYIILSFLCVRM